MNGTPEQVAELVVPLVAIGGGLLVAIVAIVAGSLKTVATTRMQESSRREIAAYVAEGSISPDDAVRILSAGGSGKNIPAQRKA